MRIDEFEERIKSLRFTKEEKFKLEQTNELIETLKKLGNRVK
ncbi:MAG: hypothetical protein U9Q73_02145 [Nanoarchaeota archaeon]|nr:hypothetical protein [Nanoarchaeota archaeon]